MEVNPSKKAIELMRKDYNIDAILSRGLVTFQCQKVKIPKVIQTLVVNDISVY